MHALNKLRSPMWLRKLDVRPFHLTCRISGILKVGLKHDELITICGRVFDRDGGAPVVGEMIFATNPYDTKNRSILARA